MHPKTFLSAAWTGLVLALGLSGLSANTLLVANKSDDTLQLIDVASGRSYATLPTGHAPHEVVVSPDGSTAVVSNYGDRDLPGSSLTVVDVQRASVARTVPLGEHTRPHGLAWFGATQVAVTAEGSGHLLIVDVEAGSIVRAIPTGQQVSHMVAVTPDDRLAFVSNIGSGSVTVVDLSHGVKVTDIATGEGAEGIAIDSHGREVWVSNRAADTLSVIDIGRLEVAATVPCRGFPIRVAFTPDGSRVLVSAARSGDVVVFDSRRRQELKRRALDLSNAPDASRRLFADQFGDSPVPVGLQMTPAGDATWVAATQADVVLRVDTAALVVREVIHTGREPDGMAYSPLGPQVSAERPQESAR